MIDFIRGHVMNSQAKRHGIHVNISKKRIQQDRYQYPNGARISVAPTVTAPRCTPDFYGMGSYPFLNNSGGRNRGTYQPVTDQRAPVPLLSRRGISRGLGRMVVSILCLALLGVLMVKMINLGEIENNIQARRMNIAETRREVESKQAAYEAKRRSVNVGYEAARNGMISSEEESVIMITLPVYDSVTHMAQQLDGGYLANLSGD